jgi:hypothetical protein
MMSYQCPCGRQYNPERIHTCPACRVPFGQESTPRTSEVSTSAHGAGLAGRAELRAAVTQPHPQISDAPIAGWYPDPNGLPSDRYWDGSSWTEQTRPQTVRRQSAQATQPQFVPAPRLYGANVRSGSHKQFASERQISPQNGFGTAALILGIVAMFTPIIAPTLAVILGYIGLGKWNRGEATNRGMALWGIWLGWVSWAVWVLLYFVAINA